MGERGRVLKRFSWGKDSDLPTITQSVMPKVLLTAMPSITFQIHFSILPSARHTLDYKLFPLSPGYVTLPKLHLSLPRYQGDIDTIVRNTIPSHVFIKVCVEFNFFVYYITRGYKHEVFEVKFGTLKSPVLEKV